MEVAKKNRSLFKDRTKFKCTISISLNSPVNQDEWHDFITIYNNLYKNHKIFFPFILYYTAMIDLEFPLYLYVIYWSSYNF